MNKPKDFNMEEFEKCYLENYKYLYTVEELGIEKESERETVTESLNSVLWRVNHNLFVLNRMKEEEK